MRCTGLFRFAAGFTSRLTEELLQNPEEISWESVKRRPGKQGPAHPVIVYINLTDLYSV